MTTGANVARALALLVAALFTAAPFVIWFWILLPGDELNWGKALLAFAYLSGAALLGIGAIRWYGKGARVLRAWGFVLLLAGALGNITMAFALVPLALLAVPSLRNRERGDAEEGRKANFSARARAT
jgi:hypothetical protein